MGQMNRHKLPYGDILMTLAIYVIDVVLNYFVPSEVFEIALNISSLGVISTWASSSSAK